MSPSDSLEVTLRPIDSRDEFTERKIILKPNSKISIGRASKNAYKNLRSSPNNAFIDSPVVSRDHAIISANSSCGIPTVYIKDSGSMHGTLVNKVRLEKSKEHQLKNGDVLQFGTDVHRDNETFIAQKFRFESRPTVSSATEEPTVSRTYSVPEADTSDEEEESEDDSSIAEASDHESLSSLPEKPSSSSEELKCTSSPTSRFSDVVTCGMTSVSEVDRLGSQSNPVNITDDNEVTTQTKVIFIDIEDEEEPALKPQSCSMPKNKSEIDDISLAEANGDKSTITTTGEKANDSKDFSAANDTLSDYHEDDDSDAECGHDSERMASTSPRSYRFQSYMDNLEDESDYEEHRSIASDISQEDMPRSVDVELDYDSEASEMEAEVEETASHAAPFENPDETNRENSGMSENSLNNSSELGTEFDIASLASDELEDCASESSDDEADATRRKMIEMLNDVHQKNGGTSSISTTVKPPPGLLSPPNPSLAPFNNVPKTATGASAPNVPPSFSQIVHANRSSTVSMSLRNIMVNEKDQATDPCVVSKEPTNKASNESPINRSAPANSWNSPKNFDMKHVDLGHMEFFDNMFEQPFPGTCRPAAPKPVPWSGDSVRDNIDVSCVPCSFTRDGSFLAWNEPPNTSPARFNYPTLPYSDFAIHPQPGDRSIPDNSSSFNRPTYDSNYPQRSAKPFNPYLGSSLPHSAPAYPRSDAVSTSSGTPAGFHKWSSDRKSGDLISPYQTVKPPSSETIVKVPTPSPQPFGEVPKPKTGMSIPEIVEDNSLQSASPQVSHKRKADTMEHEDEEAIAVDIPSTPQQETSNELLREGSEAATTIQLVALEPPQKKMRLQFAATAMAGAVVGGLTMLATLISLPDTFFQ